MKMFTAMRLGRTRAAGAVALYAICALVASGCSTQGGGQGGWGGGTRDQDRVISEELAAEPSINQFEEIGAVAAGGPLEDVTFEFDSVQLNAKAISILERDAAWAATHPGNRIEVEGHCDERGTSEYNLALGARRARAVVDGLVALGVDSDRLSTVSYGEELPLCKDAHADCWRRNRRARLVDLGSD
jgi:peptidoglycan-associated lipoprotein